MEDPQKQLIDRLKQAQNVLVTVSKNPSVDQLAAAIGLTVALNNMGKHATAVFSGQVPSTLEFLKPEETLEQNTDSLRDFIIALDKSKADKLRYKVEDNVVRIFITPYKTSVSQADLEFSQGDFNVDVVVALGVSAQQDLDDAIQAHGRILHDAVVASVTLDNPSELGTLTVVGTGVSSLSEMTAGMAQALDQSAVDSQVATAFLTGIVAVTDRFSNEHTTPQTMSVSAALMAAGANQQLISSELASPPAGAVEPDMPHADNGGDAEATSEEPKPDDGTLEIDHDRDDEPEGFSQADATPPGDNDQGQANPAEVPEEPALPEVNEPESHLSDKMPASDELTQSPPEPKPNLQVAVDENGNLASSSVEADKFMPHPSEPQPGQESFPDAHTRGRTIDPPTMGGTLTANTEPEPLGKSYDEIAAPVPQSLPPILTHDNSETPAFAPKSEEQPAATSPTPLETPAPAAPLAPPAPVEATPPTTEPTLAELEKEVKDLPDVTAQPIAHTEAASSPAPIDPDEARRAVEAALSNAGSQNQPLEPITALNAQPLGDPLHEQEQAASQLPPPAGPQPQPFVPAPGFERSASPSAFPGILPEGAQQEEDPNPPPPVPPPMIPPMP